jgi:hypothetical protein
VSVDAWREGGRDGEETTTVKQQAWRSTYSEHAPMFVTELVSQSPMGWLKALASYSATRDGWPCDVSVDAWREG